MSPFGSAPQPPKAAPRERVSTPWALISKAQRVSAHQWRTDVRQPERRHEYVKQKSFSAATKSALKYWTSADSVGFLWPFI
jgi:hypothetical protein